MGGATDNFENWWDKKVEDPAKNAWNTNVRNPIDRAGDRLNNLFDGKDNQINLKDDLDAEKKRKEEELKKLGPTPTLEDGSTDLEARRRKSLKLLRSGVLNTVRTGPRGVTTAPSLLTPQAFAYGLKSKLGQ